MSVQSSLMNDEMSRSPPKRRTDLRTGRADVDLGRVSWICLGTSPTHAHIRNAAITTFWSKPLSHRPDGIGKERR